MSQVDRLIRFVAVAEELSFVGAARRLSVDQPWLSKQIRQLESELRIKLFVRNTRRVELTPEGEALLGYARNIALAVDEAMNEVRVLARLRDKHLVIGIQPQTFWISLRDQAIEQFRERWPDIELSTETGYTAELMSLLRRKVTDIAIVPGPVVGGGFASTLITRHHPRLLVPREHPLASRRRIALRDLSGLSIATFPASVNPAAYDARYGAMLRAGAIAVPVFEGELAIIYRALRDRLLLPIFDWPQIDRLVADDFVQVDFFTPLPPVEHYLVRRAEPPSRALERFWELARHLSAQESAARAPVAVPGD